MKKAMIAPEVKDKLIKVNKAIMIYKIQMKIHKNLSKNILNQLYSLLRELRRGNLNIDEKFNKLKAVVFNNGQESSDSVNKEETNE